MAWNEPGGGAQDPWKSPRRGGGDGPNVDQWLKDLGRKIGGGSGSQGPGAVGVGLLAGIGLAVWLASGIYIVNDGQRGVVMQFGKYIETSLPGPHWHLPYPVQSVETVDVDQFRSKQMKMQMLTADENIVVVEVAVQYNVKDPAQYLFKTRDPDASLQEAGESAIREVIGKNSMDYVLTEGRSDVVIKVKAVIQEALDSYMTGLEVKSVNLQDAQPPEPVQSAFADAIKAREDEQRFINEAEAYSNEIIPRARGQATQIVEDARAYRTRVSKAAEGESKRFTDLLAEYSKAPEVTRKRLYLETVEGVLANSSKVIMDVKGGNNVVYLPLDRMMQGGRAVDAARPVEPSVPAQAPSIQTLPRMDTRARTDMRNREAP
ncbi:MAG: FtsH protease activity modulator HflK [Halothiobacillaceae bacterium]|nr:MAG: FtsH protease activity modulator HflK [Halothiobacillaceae bacterium]